MAEPLPEDPFPSTHWSVLHAGEPDLELRARICRAYKPPLVAYLRGRPGLLSPGDVVDEVVEDFLHDKILTGSLLKLALERQERDARVRFRAYLLRSLRNHLIDRRRKAAHEALPLTGEAERAEDDHADFFERLWAVELLGLACLRARDECAASNPMHWNAFKGRHFEGWSYRRMRDEFALQTENQVAGLVQRGEKVFAGHLRDVLSGQAPTEEEYQTSISALLDQLGSGAGGELVPLPFLHPLADRSPSHPRSEELAQLPIGHSPAAVSASLRRALMPNHPELALQEGLLLELCEQVPALWATLGEGAPNVPHTIGDLLSHPHPASPWLVHLKDRAKAASADPQDVLPPSTATWIYYVAIAAALVRCGQLISSTAPRDLLRGLNWAAERTWTPSAYLSLLRQACGKLANA